MDLIFRTCYMMKVIQVLSEVMKDLVGFLLKQNENGIIYLDDYNNLKLYLEEPPEVKLLNDLLKK